jgi:hypothetical protein
MCARMAQILVNAWTRSFLVTAMTATGIDYDEFVI